jgi:hypothetical protein
VGRKKVLPMSEEENAASLAAIKEAQRHPIKLPQELAAGFLRTLAPIPLAPESGRGKGRPKETVKRHVRRSAELSKFIQAERKTGIAVMSVPPKDRAHAMRRVAGDPFRKRAQKASRELELDGKKPTGKLVAKKVYKADKEGRGENDRHARRVLAQLRQARKP